MQNGDLFVSDLLNSGTLDNLEISNIEITQVTGSNYNGWYTNQSVSNTSIVAPDAQLDGIVEGSAGADVIDAGYTGDPDGDMVDANDAILPGEAPNDDIIKAGAGNDWVNSGEGNDDVYAGVGDDTVYGGNGNDLIYGDTGSTASYETVRESFEWSKAPDPNGSGGIDNGDTLTSFSQDTGNVTVDFEVVSQTSGSETEYSTDTQNVNDIEGDGATINNKSSLEGDLDHNGDKATYKLDFSSDVENVSFNVKSMAMVL